MRPSFLIVMLSIIGLSFFVLNSQSFAIEGTLDSQGKDLMAEQPEQHPVATLAGGCFWCVESEFRSKDGVLFTKVGYTGSDFKNPTYKDITTGATGHAEAVEITFDPKKITYEELLRYFLEKAHDPTQLNGQGVDIGTQYRSEIFYHNDEQKEIAERLIKEIDAKGLYSKKIVTKVSPAEKFWLGEDYHQQYYEKYEESNGKIHPRVFFKKKMKLLKGERPY